MEDGNRGGDADTNPANPGTYSSRADVEQHIGPSRDGMQRPRSSPALEGIRQRADVTAPTRRSTGGLSMFDVRVSER